MADQAKFGIAITADDKTAKGAKAAEKRLGQIPKHVSAVSRKTLDDGEKAIGSHSRRILKTFSSVEQAGAKLFGGHSITSGITTRLGALREAASVAGEGLGEASAAGEGLEGALGGLGVVAGATVGILAAAGYAAFKLADGWAKGAASIGRTADVIGVATKALQEFQAAGERAGVDKAASTNALGGIAQTLEDARYGRNNEALALLMRMGIKFKTGADGQIDTTAMTMDLADAIARQKNAQARRLIAGKFGISDAALPMFLPGSGQLKADMADADVHAGVIDDAGIARGRRIYRKGAIVSQMKDRAMMRAGSFTAGGEEAVYDGLISGGHAIMDGGSEFHRSVRDDFVPAARTMDRAANKMERASYTGGGAGRLSPSGVLAHARHAAQLRDEALRYGFSDAEAAGIAANMELESGGETHKREKGGGAGRGLMQITNAARKRLFREVMGVDIEHASRDQQWRFLRWETLHSEAAGWRRALADGQDPGSIAAGFARYIERPANPGRDSAERAAVAEAIPVHVTIDMKGAPQGTRATVKAGRSAHPAISHAFQH